MDIAAVRRGLAANAGAIAGLTALGYVPDSIVAPCFFAGETDVDFTGAMRRGMDELTVTCRILVGRADDVTSQQQLDAYLSGSGPSSLKAAIEAAPTLGGACDDLMVMQVRAYRFYTHAGAEYVGAELVVKVIGTGG